MKKYFHTALVTGAMTMLSAGAAFGADSTDKTIADWQTMAQSDLDAVKRLIQQVHPGSMDNLNPAFEAWTDSGYQQAQKLIPKVHSYDTAMAAVRYYVTGFYDGHLGYSDNARANASVQVTGWRVDLVQGAYIVTDAAPSWPAAMPPVGAKLIECDGHTVEELLRNNIAPFYDRRNFSTVKALLTPMLAVKPLTGMELKQCRFKTDQGAPIDATVHYQSATPDLAQKLLSPHHVDLIRPVHSVQLSDNILWIRSASFELRPELVTELDTVLAKLPSLASKSGITHIVFDVRNNGGGDSNVGNRLLEAATGGLEYDQAGIEKLPPVYAQWRVSDESIATVAWYVSEMTKALGPDHADVQETKQLLAKLKAAIKTKQIWVDESDGYAINRTEVQRRHGKLRRFNGTVVLLTDSACFSACLDFADAIRLIPNSIHLGQTTDADTVYLNGGLMDLPSGNKLFMPLKVWRNRTRGHNEPLVPDVPLTVDMANDAAVYQATLSALKAR